MIQNPFHKVSVLVWQRDLLNNFHWRALLLNLLYSWVALTLSLRTTPIAVITLVLAIFQPLSVAFKNKTNFIISCTKFRVKEAKFLPCKCTGKLLAFFQIFLETVRALWVNETKLTFRNAFIFNLFALESKKESKKDKRTLIWGSPRSLDLSLKCRGDAMSFMCMNFTVFF